MESFTNNLKENFDHTEELFNASIYTEKRRKISKNLDKYANVDKWKNWAWHFCYSIKTIETVEELLGIRFTGVQKHNLKVTLEKFPMSITPYYLSLIDEKNFENDPIFKQSFPDIRELNIKTHDIKDPLSEEEHSPVDCIVHRYPDRVLFMVSNVCSMYCRHCTRKRKVGDRSFNLRKSVLKKGIEYIKNTPTIRDVLISGGDPFMLSDEYIDWILSEIRKIPHIEIIRIGTRMPVVLPYRITDSLVNILKKYHPLWINTHFNHPREITISSKEALRKLADAGIPLGNQSVLLAGINDCPDIIKSLSHKLLQNRVRPYYLYQCDLSEGLEHFRTPVGKGVEIMESLRGHTTGLGIPTYVIDAPMGGGKIPVMPNYVISLSANKVVLRNYEGLITTYREPENYENLHCRLDCDNCSLKLDSDDRIKIKPKGIQKLLSDYDNTISIKPYENS